MNKDVVIYILRFSSQFSSQDCKNARLVAPYVRKDYIIVKTFKSWTGFVKLKNAINFLKNFIKASKNVIEHFSYICFTKNKDIFARICDENSSTYWINNSGPIQWCDENKYLCESDSYWLYFVNNINKDVEITECSFRFGNRIIDSSMCSRILDVHLILDDLEIKNQIIVLIN